MKTKLLLPILASCLLSFTACGDDDEGLGVDSSKSLSEVTPAEAQEICDWGDTLISEDDDKMIGCYIEGIFADQSGGCQAAFDACMAAPAEVDDTDDSCDIDTLPACASEVTVGEMETCMRAQAESFTTLGKSLSCESTSGDLENLDDMPAACEAANTKCPALFDDDEV